MNYDLGIENLSCSDSLKMLPHLCRIHQRYTIFEGSNMHPSIILKSPSNIGDNFVGSDCNLWGIVSVCSCQNCSWNFTFSLMLMLHNDEISFSSPNRLV